MKYFLLVIVTAIFILACCKDNVVYPIVETTIYQKGKCIGSGLSKSTSDSCFSYTFKDRLTIDFCVTGNCCPDSNRFISSNKISNDTIKIIIQDIAPNLCRCVCKYLIQAEFNNLSSTNLIVCCYQFDGVKQQILYGQLVKRL